MESFSPELFMYLMGWASGVLLSVCGLPLAVDAIKKGKVAVDPWFLVIWYVGEILGLAYVGYIQEPSLIFNYLLNTIFITVIGYYYFFPRKEQTNE